MDKKAASRIQSANARKNGRGTSKGSFPARAQRAADKRPKGPDHIRKADGSNDQDHSPNANGTELLFAGVVGSIGMYLLYKMSQQQARRQEAEARAEKRFEIIFVLLYLCILAVPMYACLQKLNA